MPLAIYRLITDDEKENKREEILCIQENENNGREVKPINKMTKRNDPVRSKLEFIFRALFLR